jgi:coenzyme F420-0:L-glutamate ligase / coenzyme F420-1:gamma-L-glutamate ligase
VALGVRTGCREARATVLVLTLIPIEGLPLIRSGDPLAELLVRALADSGISVLAGDVLVIAQKIVSKAEGRVVRLKDVEPSSQARELAEESAKDPRIVELILQESRQVLRIRPGLIVVEDVRGFVCANAGIDRSNIEQGGDGEQVALLPVDCDRSAREIRECIHRLTGTWISVLINDSHGRAWREGTVGVTLGLAGMQALWDRRGDVDLTGYTLEHTVIGLADEVAAAASLLMGPASEGIPAVLLRGLRVPAGDGGAKELQRARETDLFR